jgi:hypothetical protein
VFAPALQEIDAAIATFSSVANIANLKARRHYHNKEDEREMVEMGAFFEEAERRTRLLFQSS